jgi:hypothetical protein
VMLLVGCLLPCLVPWSQVAHHKCRGVECVFDDGTSMHAHKCVTAGPPSAGGPGCWVVLISQAGHVQRHWVLSWCGTCAYAMHAGSAAASAGLILLCVRRRCQGGFISTNIVPLPLRDSVCSAMLGTTGFCCVPPVGFLCKHHYGSLLCFSISLEDFQLQR